MFVVVSKDKQATDETAMQQHPRNSRIFMSLKEDDKYNILKSTIVKLMQFLYLCEVTDSSYSTSVTLVFRFMNVIFLFWRRSHTNLVQSRGWLGNLLSWSWTTAQEDIGIDHCRKEFPAQQNMDGATSSPGSGRNAEKRQEAYCYGH